MEPNDNPQPAPPAAQPQGNEEVIDASLPEGNHELLIIRRHPFGLIALYLETVLGAGVALGLLFFLIPTVLDGDSQAKALQFALVLAVIAFSIIALVLMVATYVYRQNRWIVTDDCVHQISQRGLFNRQTSELSMANIEDVTAEQKGILAELFGFGTLRAETAGELPYFHFNYCPTPEKYAQVILHAREAYINDAPAQAKRANDLLNVPGIRR